HRLATAQRTAGHAKSPRRVAVLGYHGQARAVEDEHRDVVRAPVALTGAYHRQLRRRNLVRHAQLTWCPITRLAGGNDGGRDVHYASFYRGAQAYCVTRLRSLVQDQATSSGGFS